MKKGTLKLFKEDNNLQILFFRFISGGNAVGSLLKSLPLKVTDSYCYFYSGERIGDRAKPSESFLNPRLFHARETPFLSRESTTKRALSFFC